MKPKIIFVTGNQHKLEEVQNLLTDFEVVGQKIDLPELQGNPEIIVKEKVKEACRQLNCTVIVDDTSVHLNAFNGFPGAYAADYQKVVGNERTLKMMKSFDNRDASMVSRVAYCQPGNEPIVFEGKVEGKIASEIKGNEGFGFDPIFVPEDKGKTFAEMPINEKNEVNHRARAFGKLADYLREKLKNDQNL